MSLSANTLFTTLLPAVPQTLPIIQYDSVVGLRAPFHGVSDWSTQRESLADAIESLVQEVDGQLQSKITEFN